MLNLLRKSVFVSEIRGVRAIRGEKLPLSQFNVSPPTKPMPEIQSTMAANWTVQ